jgi:site-specific DNA-adenine methylase
MAQYGLPYMGSKSGICDELIRIFPSADHFYDLFGGGFSVTHAMMINRSKDFKKFHFNEIRSGMCDLIKDAIYGKYNYKVFKPEFVDRETFFSIKEKEPYIKICWSFGNNGRDYLFSKEIEPYKKSMHQAVVFNEFDDLAKEVFGCSEFKEGYLIDSRRHILRSRIEYFRKNGKIPKLLIPFLPKKTKNFRQLQQLQQLQRLEQLELLERLQQLQQLQRLEQLELLERLEFSSLSYDQVDFKSNSIIYCDPPYNNTAKYDSHFNHSKFLNWANEQTSPVFISEYKIDDKRFKPLFKIQKRSLLSQDKTMKVKNEFVFGNKSAIDLLFSMRSLNV